jgi:serine protease Do
VRAHIVPEKKGDIVMLRARKPLSVAVASAAVIATAVAGVEIFHDVQFARADEHVAAVRRDLATVQEGSAIFREIHEAVEPSVVNIQVTKTIEHEHSQIPPEMQRFFHDFGGGMNLPPGFFNNEQGSSSMREVGTGSGVIMDVGDGYGYILTNNHVAGGASEMTVTLNDGRVIKDAQLVGADPRTDLAVIKIKADHLIPARWGDSAQLEAGDEILAFGSPFGYVGSMTHGIVSALHRQAGILGADGYENFIQVDAPINPGNSGGPLVDLHGDVVGINTAIASSSGGFQGIGFAIPSEEAKPVYEQLKSTGKIVRGWLGVEIQNVAQAQDAAASEGYKDLSGVMVRGVLKDSPATAKLEPGDVITSLNGKSVANAAELRDRIAWDKPGADVTLGVYRDHKQQDVTIKLGEQPSKLNELASATPSESHSSADMGVTLGDVNDDNARQFNVTDKSGAVVLQVNPNSPAAQAGVQPGDVITQINGAAVSSADQAAQALAKADLKSGVRMQVDNSQGSEMLFVKTDQG